jgi:3-oxoacyl-[acyl-carrier-protein] synthase II
VNTHGTSTHEGDIAEIRAIKNCFGEAAEQVRVSSTKSMTGHLVGAAGAIEAAACILALNRKRIPPTLNLDDLDPECAGVHHVAHQAEDCEVELALDNSFGFGGHNACLAFVLPA